MRPLLILLIPLATAQWIPSDYPNPTINFTACGRHNKSYVCDPDHIITRDTADKLDAYIHNITQIISPCGKYQMGIALCDSMDLHQMGVDATKAVEEFAQDLHNTWEIGNIECNDGILFFLSKDDRKMYISLGIIVREQLTDDIITKIIDNMEGCLNQGNYDCAVLHMVDDIEFVLNNGTLNNKNRNMPLPIIIMLSVIGGLCCYIACLAFIADACREYRSNKIIKYKKLRHVNKINAYANKKAKLYKAFGKLSDIAQKNLLNDLKITCDDLNKFLTDSRKFVPSICCKCITTTSKLNCGHPICKDCLSTDIKCPVCRQDIYKPTMEHQSYRWEEFKYRMEQIGTAYNFPLAKYLPSERIYRQKLRLKPYTFSQTVVQISNKSPLDYYYLLIYTNNYYYYDTPILKYDYGSCSTSHHTTDTTNSQTF